MTNNKYNNIKIPENIDLIVESGAKRASNEKRKRKNKRAIAIAASLSVIMTLGVVSQPAIAQNIPIFNTAYEALGFSKGNLAVSKYIGRVVEDNGTKVTIEDIIANENTIKVTVKMESENKEFIKDQEGVFFRADFGGVKSTSLSKDDTIVDENTKLMVVEINSPEKFPESGRLAISLNNEKYNFKGSFKLDIDFKESFSKQINRELKLEEEMPGVNIYGFKSATKGILLEVSQGSVGGEKDKSKLYLKIDGKIYANDGGYGNANRMYLEFETLEPEVILNAKDISVIESSYIGPYSIKTYEANYDKELEAKEDARIQEETKDARAEEERIYNEAERATTNGISYVKEINFINGGKSEIYKTERENGLIKIYIKGDNKKELFSLADNIAIYQQSEEKFTGIEKNSIEETEDGYIVEFNDLVKGDLKVHGDYPIQQGEEWNQYGDEVKLILK